MAAISATAVKELREKTGVGMMEAKKALEEAGSDFEKAVDILRKKGLSAAAKKAARVASEGMIASVNQSKVVPCCLSPLHCRKFRHPELGAALSTSPPGRQRC